MKLKEFLQEILPTEVDYNFLPSDLAEMDVVINCDIYEMDVEKVERDYHSNQLIIHLETK